MEKVRTGSNAASGSPVTSSPIKLDASAESAFFCFAALIEAALFYMFRVCFLVLINSVEDAALPETASWEEIQRINQTPGTPKPKAAVSPHE